MILNYLCPPALLYAVIMLIYLVLELSNEKYHQAFVKAIIGIIFTCILQAFCQMNLGVISWTFVMIPIIFYTYITLLTFFMFGVNPKKLDIDQSDISSNIIPKNNENIDKWLPSKHVSSTPITTTLYTPSIVPIDSYSKPDISNENVPSSNVTSTTASTTSTNSGTSFSYYHPKPSASVSNMSNKLVPVTVCTRQKIASMCNSLSVCAWTGKECINTSEFDTRIHDLDVSCSSMSDTSCNYQDNCYLLSVADSGPSGKAICLPSIPSIGELLNNTDCKTLLNQMKYDTSTNTTLSTSINDKGCRSIANRIYSLLV